MDHVLVKIGDNIKSVMFIVTHIYRLEIIWVDLVAILAAFLENKLLSKLEMQAINS